MSNASMALIEEAQYEVNKNNGKCMVTKITKDGDVTVTSKGEEEQRFQEENSWTSIIIMLINFMFTIVIGRLNCIYAGRGEPIDNLFARKRKEEMECSKKSEHMLEEPKNQLQT